MRTNSRQLHNQANYDRAVYIGAIIARALGATAQFISKAWRSSSSRGTKSRVLS